MVYGGGRWNLQSGRLLLFNSEFLILNFFLTKSRLQTNCFRSFPDQFEWHIAGGTRPFHHHSSWTI